MVLPQVVVITRERKIPRLSMCLCAYVGIGLGQMTLQMYKICTAITICWSLPRGDMCHV